MRILMLNYGFPPLGGDSGKASFSLLREYSKMSDMTVDFVCASVDEKYHLLKMGENITIHRLPIGKNADNLDFQSEKQLKMFAWRAYWFCRSLAGENKYDLTHSFFAVPCGFVSYLLKKKFKIPYVITLRGADVPGYSERFAKWHKENASRLKKILDKASFATSCNQNLKNLMLQSGCERQIEVFYDGVDAEKYFPNFQARNPDNFTLVCVSDLAPQKGVRVLIQAFKILSSRYDKLRLIIVGDGSEKQSLQDLVMSLDISDKVVLVGQLAPDEVVKYYQKADAFVNPTFLDEANETVLEALACGLPVIATGTFANKEILSENVTGLFVKTKDPDDLAEKIERLLLNQGLCQTLEKNAGELARQLSWKMIASDYVDLYVKTKNIAHIRQ